MPSHGRPSAHATFQAEAGRRRLGPVLADDASNFARGPGLDPRGGDLRCGSRSSVAVVFAICPDGRAHLGITFAGGWARDHEEPPPRARLAYLVLRLAYVSRVRHVRGALERALRRTSLFGCRCSARCGCCCRVVRRRAIHASDRLLGHRENRHASQAPELKRSIRPRDAGPLAIVLLVVSGAFGVATNAASSRAEPVVALDEASPDFIQAILSRALGRLGTAKPVEGHLPRGASSVRRETKARSRDDFRNVRTTESKSKSTCAQGATVREAADVLANELVENWGGGVIAIDVATGVQRLPDAGALLGSVLLKTGARWRMQRGTVSRPVAALRRRPVHPPGRVRRAPIESRRFGARARAGARSAQSAPREHRSSVRLARRLRGDQSSRDADLHPTRRRVHRTARPLWVGRCR